MKMSEKPAIPSLVLVPAGTKDDYTTIYSIACAYAYSGLLISDQGKEIDQPILSFPAVVCSSFAIELFLKFFINLEIAEGSQPNIKRNHVLDDLWNQISPARQGIIAGMFQTNFSEPAIDALETRISLFRQALKNISAETAPFVKWRYAHELKNVSLMSHAAIEEISDALNRAATYSMRLKFNSSKISTSDNSSQARNEAEHAKTDTNNNWEDPKRLIRKVSGSLHVLQGHEPILLNRESPLRRLPVNIDAKTAVFFDGIRFTVEFLDIAYNRLYETLTQIAY